MAQCRPTRIRPKVPKLATLMDSAEQDVLAYMTFPKAHWTKFLHSSNPSERIERRDQATEPEVVGIFPNGRRHRQTGFGALLLL